MDVNDFYEDDEDLDARAAAWRTGEPLVSTGSREISEDAKQQLAAAARRWDAMPGISLTVVTNLRLSNSSFVESNSRFIESSSRFEIGQVDRVAIS